MKKITNFLFLILLLATNMACQETRNVVKPGDKPVIEAYLAPNHEVSMKVFTEIPYSGADTAYAEPINGLNIKISLTNGQSFNLQSNGEGIYTSKVGEKIGGVGSSVSMAFNYNGRNITANTIIPAKPIGFSIDKTEIERVERNLSSGFGPGNGGPGGFLQEDRTPINLTWQNPENDYHFVAAQTLEQNASPIIILPSNNTNFRPPRRFNNQPIQTNASSLQPQSFEYFGKYAIILYRLNSDYAALYENNNSTSQNIATPITTITNGLGIFTGINADTLVLNVKKKN